MGVITDYADGNYPFSPSLSLSLSLSLSIRLASHHLEFVAIDRNTLDLAVLN